MDDIPTLIGPLKRGRPGHAGSAAIDDALRGPRINSLTQSPSSARRALVGGGHRGTWGTFSLKLVDAIVVEDSSISAASYVNVARIDGYVPGMGMFLPEEGAWSVAFSFGVCEAGRLRAISRLFRGSLPQLDGPRQPPVAGAPLVGVPPVAVAGVGPDPPLLAQPSVVARARAPGRVTRLVGPGDGWHLSPPEYESSSSGGGGDVLIEDLD